MSTESIRLVGLDTPKAYQLRDFLQRADLPFTWIQVTTDDEARELAHVESLSDRRLPTCKLSSGNVLFAPSVEELAAALKWQRPPQRGEYDVAIYGAGPAGLSAAVHAASEGLRTILIEKSTVGGQAGSTSLIENYLGFPDGIPGEGGSVIPLVFRYLKEQRGNARRQSESEQRAKQGRGDVAKLLCRPEM